MREPLISCFHSLFSNALQLWLQIKTEFICLLFFPPLCFLPFPVIICSRTPGWRYDHSGAGGETQAGMETRGGGGGVGRAGKRQQREDDVKNIKWQQKMEEKRKCCWRGNWRHKGGKETQDFCLDSIVVTEHMYTIL